MRDERRPSQTAEAEPVLVELSGVSVAYAERLALQDVTFRVVLGARVAVVGPNGAGKSTLFKALAGLLPLAGGQLLVRGRPLSHHAGRIAYVPQREEVDWGFPVSVSDVVMMGRYGALHWPRRPGAADRAVLRRSLEELGIADLADRPIGELSGGQQQRVFLARALAQEPHLLLLDEPFTGVDAATQEATLALIDQLQARGVTVLISTHDLSLAALRFEQVLLLNRRLIAYGPPAQALTPQTLSEAFGRQMFMLPGGTVVVDQCCPPGTEAGVEARAR